VACKYFSKKKSGGQIFVCLAQSNLGKKLVKKRKKKFGKKKLNSERERERTLKHG
jgi:hypothetical protein